MQFCHSDTDPPFLLTKAPIYFLLPPDAMDHHIFSPSHRDIDRINVSWLIVDFLLFLLKVKQNYIGEAKEKSLVAKISFQSDCKSQLSVTCLSTITRHLLYLILLNLFHKKQKT